MLLKNNARILPLQPGNKTIAVIGQPAGSAGLAQFVSGGGSGHVNAAAPVSPLNAIAVRAAATGGDVVSVDGSDPDAAAALARNASVAIVFAYDVEREGTDRTSLALPDNQDRLIEQVAKANPHTIVLLDTGGPVLMPLDRPGCIRRRGLVSGPGGRPRARGDPVRRRQPERQAAPDVP